MALQEKYKDFVSIIPEGYSDRNKLLQAASTTFSPHCLPEMSVLDFFVPTMPLDEVCNGLAELFGESLGFAEGAAMRGER